MCTYNGEKYLSEQLESIARQSLLPSELIVCDDGSDDATAGMVSAFARSAPFPVRFIQNSLNMGSTKNFEQAMRLCKGELIALCDQDDCWDPKKLEVLTNVLRTSGAGGVFSDGFLMDDTSKLTGRTLWGVGRFSEHHRKFNDDSHRQQGISTLLRCNVVTGATMMFRSHLREELLPCPQEWIHDGWLAWMLVLHSQLIAHPECLIRYRIHASQQVGVAGRSIAARLRRARATGANDYRSIEKQFAVLFRYAESHPEICGPDLCRRINEKQKHSAFRAALKPNKLQRVKEIATRSSAYNAYSQGWQSMLKDVLL